MRKFQTKAQTLVGIKSKLKKSKICESLVFSVKDWYSSDTKVINLIQSKFKNTQIIVRSSAMGEDGLLNSMAGAFDSVKNISSNDSGHLTTGIETVIKSYGNNCNQKNEILIQSMVPNVSMSGVVFTHELNHGSPYYVINYDDISGLTDTVTSGDSEYSNRTLFIHRKSHKNIRSNRFIKLITSIKEVEKIMNSQFLDIEFAIDEDHIVYILQVRAITTQKNWNRSIVKSIDSTLNGINILLKNKFKPIDGIYGDNTVFGQMPDWNPAEMIGRAPRALAFSLYEKLITDDAWRIARKAMGYFDPIGQPLMVSLGGQPFIDTRLSFQSYLPKNLDPGICHKLVNAWVDKLKENPELHDKIEFDIAITTYSFDIDERINHLIGNILNKKEKKIFKEFFLELTIPLLSGESRGSIDSAMKKIDELAKKQASLGSYNNDPNLNQLNAIIHDCINLGTIPFSILARHGFIAKTLLYSLVHKGVLSDDDVSQFFSSVSTVASELVNDMNLLQSKKLGIEKFMGKYGHLRPGTYDISSPRYDQIPEFGEMDYQEFRNIESKKFEIGKSQKKEIDGLLKDDGLTDLDSDNLFRYMADAIKGREYGKFVFSRSVSTILEIIARFGEQHFLSRDELSHISINDFLSVIKHSDEEEIEIRLRKISKKNEELVNVSSAIRLPQVLYDYSGIFVIPFQVSQPNFITNKKASSKSISLKSGEDPPSLVNKLVLIENADPGFDWIFSQKISGLITKYGGANSHMAIRCAEFNIPAAIGCGEQRYESLLNAKHIMLDCSASLIKIMD